MFKRRIFAVNKSQANRIERLVGLADMDNVVSFNAHNIPFWVCFILPEVIVAATIFLAGRDIKKRAVNLRACVKATYQCGV